MKFTKMIPKNVDAIKLADTIKRGMTLKSLKDAQLSRKISAMKNKGSITKREAIMIADWIKSGMSVEALNDLKEFKSVRPKLLKAA